MIGRHCRWLGCALLLCCFVVGGSVAASVDELWKQSDP